MSNILKRLFASIRQWSLRSKFILAFVCMILVFTFSAYFNLQQVEGIERQSREQQATLDKRELALQLKEHIQQLVIMTSNLIISKDPEIIPQYEEELGHFRQSITIFRENTSTMEERNFGALLQTASGEYANYFAKAAETIENTSLNQEDLNQALYKVFDQMQLHKDYITEMIDEMNLVYEEDSHQLAAQSVETLAETSMIFTVLPPIVILFSVIVAFLIIRSFTKPIQRLQNAVSRMASGDIRHKIHAHNQDELGKLSRSFNDMLDTIQGMLGTSQHIAYSLREHAGKFKDFSVTTSDAHGRIVQAMKGMATGAEDQASQAERGAALIHDMNEDIQQISEYTLQMKDSSSQALEKSHTGTKAVSLLKQTSDQSEKVLGQTYSSIETLAASVKEIGEIAEKIADIAHQTNILSLNAAIEASRAGQHGKGFAVIAEEVRKLSVDSRQSSTLVAEKVSNLSIKMKEAQQNMLEARGQVKQQQASVSATIESFQSMTHSIDDITPQINHIHERMESSKIKNEEVVQTIQLTASVSQQTAAAAQEMLTISMEQDSSIRDIAGQADEIAQLSHQLFAQISRFQTDEEEPSSEFDGRLQPVVQVKPAT